MLSRASEFSHKKCSRVAENTQFSDSTFSSFSRRGKFRTFRLSPNHEEECFSVSQNEIPVLENETMQARRSSKIGNDRIIYCNIRVN